MNHDHDPQPAKWEEIASPKHDTPPDTAPAPTAPSATKKVKAMAMNRMVWVMVIVALVFLAGGIGISQLVISPSQAAAETDPPVAGLITVPAEKMTLSNDVTVRGDARYDDGVDVALQTGDLGGPAVVTGAVPTVGQELQAGNVALEIVGRPVIVLKGELPVYRTLVSGTSGPDVVQLREALSSMGYQVGEGDVYDSNLAAAVRQMFADAGYSAPQVDQGILDAAVSAEEGVKQAQQALASANAAITQAAAGPSSAEKIRLDNAVNSAQRALDAAKACQKAPAPDCLSVADAEDSLRLAQASRDDGLKTQPLDAQYAARDDAARAVTEAQANLSTAQANTLTPVPASQILYLSSLPRRVDTVNVSRGSIVPTTAVMTVSGATLEIEASVSSEDASLLKVGQKGSLVQGESTLPATITEINQNAKPTEPAAEGSETATTGRVQVILTPDKLTEDQRTQLVGANVRVVIPVNSTKGEVLVVPVAALTAGAGGETRVQVLRQGTEEAELVTVKTGLSAGGYAEIVSSEAPLEAGDQVVVGS